MEEVLDYRSILQKTPNHQDLSVTLKSTPAKGVGLFATRPIHKNEVIAFYKLKVFILRDYKSPTRDVYSCYLYTKKGNQINNLIADLYEGSVPLPMNGIPFWGHFANEPSINEYSNCELHINASYNYRDKTRIKAGDTVLYELRATKYISPGREVLWHYGDNYCRNYVASKL